MSAKIILTAFVSTLFVAAPVAAFSNTPTPAPRPAPTTEGAASAKRYCVVETTTGSRIAKKICRTRAEWLAEGFDPLAK